MCMACDEAALMYRYRLLEYIAKGEMPPNHTEEDLRAMELPLPSEVELVRQDDGTLLLKRKQPASEAAAMAGAGAFACDSPDGE